MELQPEVIPRQWAQDSNAISEAISEIAAANPCSTYCDRSHGATSHDLGACISEPRENQFFPPRPQQREPSWLNWGRAKAKTKSAREIDKPFPKRRFAMLRRHGKV